MKDLLSSHVLFARSIGSTFVKLEAVKALPALTLLALEGGHLPPSK